MSEKAEEGGGKLGFLDPLARLFHGRRHEAAPEPAAPAPDRLASLDARFDQAIQGLEQKVQEARSAASRRAAAAGGLTTEDRATRSERRMQEAHRAIRKDIEQMHVRLGTELADVDLGELATYLEDLDATAAEGADSHNMLPRMIYAIASRLNKEAGELAVARLTALLRREKMAWPDPTQYRPSDPPEQIEASRRRRLAEVRERFLAQGIGVTARRLLGIVRNWSSDYPDRGSTLWEECVLEGVAAGLRGQLVRESAELLMRDRELLLDRLQASIGKQLDAMHAALEGGVHSLEQANRAVASALRVLDQVVPELAWQYVQEQIPRARGEDASPPGGVAGGA